MAENEENIMRNPKLPSFVRNNRQKLNNVDQKKEEINLPETKSEVVTIPAPEVVPPPPIKAEIKHHGKFSHPAIVWSV